MLKSIEGVYRDGHIELAEAPTVVGEARVIVTFLASNGPIDLLARGITEQEAARMRAGFAAFADDWDRPEMDVYNDM